MPATSQTPPTSPASVQTNSTNSSPSQKTAVAFWTTADTSKKVELPYIQMLVNAIQADGTLDPKVVATFNGAAAMVELRAFYAQTVHDNGTLLNIQKAQSAVQDSLPRLMAKAPEHFRSFSIDFGDLYQDMKDQGIKYRPTATATASS